MKINGFIIKQDDTPKTYTPILVHGKYRSMRINLHKDCGLIPGRLHHEIAIPELGAVLIIPVENMGKIEIEGGKHV